MVTLGSSSNVKLVLPKFPNVVYCYCSKKSANVGTIVVNDEILLLQSLYCSNSVQTSLVGRRSMIDISLSVFRYESLLYSKMTPVFAHKLKSDHLGPHDVIHTIGVKTTPSVLLQCSFLLVGPRSIIDISLASVRIHLYRYSQSLIPYCSVSKHLLFCYCSTQIPNVGLLLFRTAYCCLLLLFNTSTAVSYTHLTLPTILLV